MALKRKNQNQIQVADYKDIINGSDQKKNTLNTSKSKNDHNHTKKLMSLNFSHTLTENVKIKLAGDCSSLIFIDKKE